MTICDELIQQGVMQLEPKMREDVVARLFSRNDPPE